MGTERHKKSFKDKKNRSEREGVTCKAEDFWVAKNLLEEGELPLSVLPVPVEQVHWEQTLQQ